MMKARCALVPNKGSTAILDEGSKPEGSRLDCDDGYRSSVSVAVLNETRQCTRRQSRSCSGTWVGDTAGAQVLLLSS